MRHRRHRKPDCRHHIENCDTCGEKGHTSQVCSSGQSTSANARALEVDSQDTEEDPIVEIHDVWAITVCTTTEHTLHESSEDNLSMIMDSGAEEHVVTRADCQRLGGGGRREGGGGEEGALLQPAQVRLRSATCVATTWKCCEASCCVASAVNKQWRLQLWWQTKRPSPSLVRSTARVSRSRKLLWQSRCQLAEDLVVTVFVELREANH